MAAVTIYYLEMLDRSVFRPSASPDGFIARPVQPPAPQVNRRFYESVGRRWHWTERLAWSDDDWSAHVHRPTLRTWIGRCGEEEIGYFELESQAGGDVQIVYFGLLSEFIGRGLGGALLSEAVRQAWALPQTRRVWVHTCTEDHPHALENYQRRGFAVYKTAQVVGQASSLARSPHEQEFLG